MGNYEAGELSMGDEQKNKNKTSGEKMAIDETKLQAIIDEQQDRIEALENFCALRCHGMLMVL